MKAARLMVFCCLLFGQSADAETYLFVGSEFPLLSEQSEDGRLSGIAVDVTALIGKRLGHTIVMRLYPWERAKYMVRNGLADALMAPYKNAERETWLDFSDNYFFTDYAFFYVSPGRSIRWTGDYRSLQDRKIGVVQGWSVGADFDQAKASLDIDYAPSLEICFKKLLAGRIDMIPTSSREAKAVFARLGLAGPQRPVAVWPELTKNHNYFGFTRQKDRSELKAQFDRMLTQLKANGELAALVKEKYGLSDEELR